MRAPCFVGGRVAFHVLADTIDHICFQGMCLLLCISQKMRKMAGKKGRMMFHCKVFFSFTEYEEITNKIR